MVIPSCRVSWVLLVVWDTRYANWIDTIEGVFSLLVLLDVIGKERLLFIMIRIILLLGGTFLSLKLV